MTSLRACRAVPDVSVESRSASRRAGIVSSIAWAPRCSCKTSNAFAAAARTAGDESTKETRTAAAISASWPSRCESVVLSLRNQIQLGHKITHKLTYMISVRTKHTPSRVAGLGELAAERKSGTISPSIFSPSLRHSSAIVLAAVCSIRQF